MWWHLQLRDTDFWTAEIGDAYMARVVHQHILNLASSRYYRVYANDGRGYFSGTLCLLENDASTSQVGQATRRSVHHKVQLYSPIGMVED
jgi:hypothetical protein